MKAPHMHVLVYFITIGLTIFEEGKLVEIKTTAKRKKKRKDVNEPGTSVWSIPSTQKKKSLYGKRFNHVPLAFINIRLIDVTNTQRYIPAVHCTP